MAPIVGISGTFASLGLAFAAAYETYNRTGDTSLAMGVGAGVAFGIACVGSAVQERGENSANGTLAYLGFGTQMGGLTGAAMAGTARCFGLEIA